MSVPAKIGQRALEDFPPDVQRFLLDIGKRLDPVADLSGGASSADQITKINEILAALRDAGKMI